MACCALLREVSLLVANALNTLDKLLVDVNYSSIFGLHHLKDFEIDEMIV